MLSVHDVSYSYGKIAAVRNVSLTVSAGQAVALVGANGAGKTTLVRVISGVLPAASGRTEFLSRDLTRWPDHERVRVGLVQVPEGRHVFTGQTVRTNLLLGAFGARRPRREAEADLERVYGMFPRLRERESQAAGTLSGGEQQMLALGRALMAAPKLLILDEPSMGLAPIIVEQILEVLQSLKAQGIAMLLVEQNAALALRLTDYAYVIENGSVAVAGFAQELASSEQVRRIYMGAH